MDELGNFASKSFIEQVELLEDIEKKKEDAAIPGLVELCKKSDPSDQAAVMAENTLRSLLLENEAQTVKCLMSDHGNIKKISLQVCCRKKFPSAAPVLLKLFTDLMSEQTSEMASGELMSDELNPRYKEGFEILSALVLIQPPEALGIFRQNLHNKDSLIASLSIEAVGKYNDVDSVDALCKIVEESEAGDRYEQCDLTVAGAIDSLAMIHTDKALSFLASKIHHRNPVARRIIHAVFPRLGPETIRFIAPFIYEDNTDLKIMAVNLLGTIGDKKGVDCIEEAIDKGIADHPNVKFAVYEALGKIFSIRSLVRLVDGLFEQEPSLLIAVISSLNHQINPGVVKKLKNMIDKGDDQSSRLINAVVAARALSLFESLYEDQAIGDKMVDVIIKSSDRGFCGAFLKKLKSIDSKRAESDRDKISSVSSVLLKKRVLIVDDSESMLAFYRSIASAMGLSVITAENGRKALDILEEDKLFDLILTDLNMPVMTGIELTQKIRTDPSVEKIPIVVVSTESEESQEQLAIKMGADDFMKKPFTADQLQVKIKTLI
ncbi:response regulator [uncultured Desulfobacter sp.]|uniref:response regulator n=1 Tax=uncultured Desulfobacter sp. TaxID=240139 RepID=UPI002AAA63EE|nr:response regulator [uncultured Desulfobacter sp.]